MEDPYPKPSSALFALAGKRTAAGTPAGVHDLAGHLWQSGADIRAPPDR